MRVWCRWRAWPRVLLAVALLVAAAACGPGAPVPEPAPQSVAPAGGAALASLAVEDAEGVRLEVVDVTRPALGVVEVQLTLVNIGASAFDLGERWAAAGEPGALSELALAEPDGQKRHFVLRDDHGRPLCSTGEAPIAAGERRQLWARFGAPANSVPSVRLVAGSLESGEFALPPAP
ncbi:MAG: hypothetical protein KJ066_16645 [Acidobacteria bacterium]|nr:hypothetical protein [Acidobacteriota bacterium]